MGKYFGTDGMRGIAGKDLTPTHAYKIGRFLGSYARLEGGGKVVVGKDTRLSCPMLEYALISGLSSVGADTYALGVFSTPGVCFSVTDGGFDFGVMISASHNPFFDNGIKVINKHGEKISEELTEEIESFLDSEDNLENAQGIIVGKVIDYSQAREKYIKSLINVSGVQFKKLKVGIDCAYGATSYFAKEVYEALGAQVYAINDKPNGININSGCGATNLNMLCELVKKKKLDIGFAYDGDGDRCIAVDENGEVVDGDKIMFVLARELNERGKLSGKTVVTTVMSNMGLEKALSIEGIATTSTKVGDYYVYCEMKRGGYSLGGEQSGHVILSDYATTGDGVLTSIKLTESIINKKTSLSFACKELKAYHQLTKNVRAYKKDEILSSPYVKNQISKITSILDGGLGRALVRASGTEPLIRIMVEAKDKIACQSVLDELYRLILSEAENESTKS